MCENDNNEVKIDVSLIPDYVKERLAAATLEAFLRFMKQPGAREMLEKKKEELGLGD